MNTLHLLAFTMPVHRPCVALIEIDSLTNLMFVMAGMFVLIAAALVAYALWMVTEIRRRMSELNTSQAREHKYQERDWK